MSQPASQRGEHNRFTYVGITTNIEIACAYKIMKIADCIKVRLEDMNWKCYV
jgi:hypothetical protein